MKKEFKTGATKQTKKRVNDEWKSSAEQSKKGKPVKLTLDIVYAGDKVGPGYFTFKDGELSSKSPYKGHKMPSKIVFAIKESVETKKERLDEGMVMISSLLPVGGLIGMPPKRVDNFEFKGLPGQFNENGDKVFDNEGNKIEIEEETITEATGKNVETAAGLMDAIKKTGTMPKGLYVTVKVGGKKYTSVAAHEDAANGEFVITAK